MRLPLLALLVACGGTQHPAPPRPTTGGITGIARDHDSGDPIEQAIVQLDGRETTSDAKGSYQLTGLRPGTYDLAATFAGQPITVEHVVVRAGQLSYVDLAFTLGRPAPIREDYTVLSAIDRYTPPHLAPTVALIEGTVNDANTHERIVGAVVTAVGPGAGAAAQTLQTVSDEQGRYRFDSAPPGVYVVSTYYNVGNRQMEIRRSDIDVIGGHAVVVPLWIEAQR